MNRTVDGFESIAALERWLDASDGRSEHETAMRLMKLPSLAPSGSDATVISSWAIVGYLAAGLPVSPVRGVFQGSNARCDRSVTLGR
ncbi:MAG: hypothetical protein ACRDRW_17535 [Pseudonocardiaceae bacterium]